jgi:hypothetical protein
VVEDTESYYRRRWKEELTAAEQAAEEKAASIHRSLAARYAVLCGEPQMRILDDPEQVVNIDGVQRFAHGS